MPDAHALVTELRDAGVATIFEFYDGAGHAFFNDTNRLGTYDPDAATAPGSARRVPARTPRP